MMMMMLLTMMVMMMIYIAHERAIMYTSMTVLYNVPPATRIKRNGTITNLLNITSVQTAASERRREKKNINAHVNRAEMKLI